MNPAITHAQEIDLDPGATPRNWGRRDPDDGVRPTPTLARRGLSQRLRLQSPPGLLPRASSALPAGGPVASRVARRRLTKLLSPQQCKPISGGLDRCACPPVDSLLENALHALAVIFIMHGGNYYIATDRSRPAVHECRPLMPRVLSAAFSWQLQVVFAAMGGGFFFGHCKIPALPRAEAPTPPQMMDWLPADGENGLPEALHSSQSHALLGQAASKGSGAMSSGSAMELGELSLRAKRGCARASLGVVISTIIRRVRPGSPHCCA